MRRCFTICTNPYRFSTTTQLVTDPITHGSTHTDGRMVHACIGQHGTHSKLRHARRIHSRELRYLESWISDVSCRTSQRHQPAIRNVREWRRRYGEENPIAR